MCVVIEIRFRQDLADLKVYFDCYLNSNNPTELFTSLEVKEGYVLTLQTDFSLRLIYLIRDGINLIRNLIVSAAHTHTTCLKFWKRGQERNLSYATAIKTYYSLVPFFQLFNAIKWYPFKKQNSRQDALNNLLLRHGAGWTGSNVVITFTLCNFGIIWGVRPTFARKSKLFGHLTSEQTKAAGKGNFVYLRGFIML